MKFVLNQPKENPLNLMRDLGYAPGRDPESYIRRLTALEYPRLHAYLKLLPDENLEISLHLDQKRPSYQGQTAHSGEYDNKLLKEEKERIINHNLKS